MTNRLNGPYVKRKQIHSIGFMGEQFMDASIDAILNGNAADRLIWEEDFKSLLLDPKRRARVPEEMIEKAKQLLLDAKLSYPAEDIVPLSSGKSMATIIRKALLVTVRSFWGEFLDDQTRSKIANEVHEILDRAKAEKYIYDYFIICDHTNNTPEIIDKGQVALDVWYSSPPDPATKYRAHLRINGGEHL